MLLKEQVIYSIIKPSKQPIKHHTRITECKTRISYNLVDTHTTEEKNKNIGQENDSSIKSGSKNSRDNYNYQSVKKNIDAILQSRSDFMPCKLNLSTNLTFVDKLIA